MIKAVFKRNDNCYSYYNEAVMNNLVFYGILEYDKEYKLEDAYITHFFFNLVYIKVIGIKDWFQSWCFDFYEDGKKIDIVLCFLRDPQFCEKIKGSNR